MNNVICDHLKYCERRFRVGRGKKTEIDQRCVMLCELEFEGGWSHCAWFDDRLDMHTDDETRFRSFIRCADCLKAFPNGMEMKAL